MSSARTEILSRIRSAIGGAAAAREQDLVLIPREYRRAGTLNYEERLELFTDRLHDYDAVVQRCDESDIPEAIASVLTERAIRRVLVPEAIAEQWLPHAFDFVRDQGFDYGQIDRVGAVLTGCAVAIALTGTIVLRHSPGEGRRALTLIPDYHLCVVYARQVVETVPEGIARMNEFGSAAITTISGPSATSDIEMTRIKGVHGPRTLDVILVDS